MIGSLFAATSDTDITPWTTIGSNAAVVGALIYFAKEFVRGKIVAQPIDQLLREAAEREHVLQDQLKRTEALLEDSKNREDSLRLILLNRGGHQQ